MLGKFLNNLRKKPKAVRENISMAAAILITLLVAVVWLVTDPVDIGSVTEVIKDGETPTAFSTLINQTKEQFVGVKESFGDATESLEEVDPKIIMDSLFATSSTSTSSIESQREVRISTTTNTASSSDTSF